MTSWMRKMARWRGKNDKAGEKDVKADDEKIGKMEEKCDNVDERVYKVEGKNDKLDDIYYKGRGKDDSVDEGDCEMDEKDDSVDDGDYKVDERYYKVDERDDKVDDEDNTHIKVDALLAVSVTPRAVLLPWRTKMVNAFTKRRGRRDM